jgi:hypothetical protein
LTDAQKLSHLDVGDKSCWIVSCSILDPYVMLILNDGDLILLKLEESSKTISKVHELKVCVFVTILKYKVAQFHVLEYGYCGWVFVRG